MKSRAAVLWQVGEEWTIEDIEIDDPGPGEVIVKTKVAGMCHSDEHMSSGALPMPHYPCIGGHEGAGEVIRVGEGVTSVAVGDHVAMSFIPSCGRCKWCVSGRQNLCDLGMHLMSPGMISDGRSRGEGVSSGRVVVVGSSEMVGADYFNIRVRASVANANLAEAVIGWVTTRRELVNIPARPVDRAALLVSARDLTKIGVYVMLLIPLAAALVGLAVSRARKNTA